MILDFRGQVETSGVREERTEEGDWSMRRHRHWYQLIFKPTRIHDQWSEVQNL